MSDTMTKDYMGVWDCKARWQFCSDTGRTWHAWLKENVVGDVNLDFVYRVEFYNAHEDEHDYEHVTYRAVIHRFDKNDKGERYILRDSEGTILRDENGNSWAAKMAPVEVILKTEVPEDLR